MEKTRWKARVMAVRYDKLWDRLKFSQLDRAELQSLAGISAPTMTRLIKNEMVAMDTMVRICSVLHCDIGDVMEVIEDV